MRLGVVVVGAGASHLLGAMPNPKMPLMADWMGDLTRRLNESGKSELARAVGLSDVGTGEEFEASLGRLLAWRRAFPTVAGMSRLGSATYTKSDEFEKWAVNATNTADGLVALVYQSLHELFARSRIGQQAARSAYERLVDLFKLPNDGALVFATTNYDVAIELALEDLGITPLTGAIPMIGSSTSGIKPKGLVVSAEASVFPVLHLHGRVGWYQDNSGLVSDAGADSAFDPNLGSPGLLLPDPDKTYTDQPVLNEMWEELNQAVEAARKVLIIGHSMHDQALANALRSVTGSGKVAYLSYQPHSGVQRNNADLERERTYVAEALGNPPQWHEGEFGPDWNPSGNIRSWSETLGW